MINKNSWIIRIGASVLIIGLIFMIVSLFYHINLGLQTPHWSFEWEEIELQLFTYRVMGILGFALFIVGIIFYTMGMRDLYFKPLKQLLYPQMPLDQQRNSITHDSHEILCVNCKRRIPYESEKCPFCGVKQLHHDNITLKNL